VDQQAREGASTNLLHCFRRVTEVEPEELPVLRWCHRALSSLTLGLSFCVMKRVMRSISPARVRCGAPVSLRENLLPRVGEEISKSCSRLAITPAAISRIPIPEAMSLDDYSSGPVVCTTLWQGRCLLPCLSLRGPCVEAAPNVVGRPFGNMGRMNLMLKSAHEIVENDPIFRVSR
jgi:hypothetical protein